MNNELMHYNHNHDALGRFAGSTGSAVRKVGNITTRKLKSARRMASKNESSNGSSGKTDTTNSNEPNINKKSGSKSNNTKLSNREREYLVKKGSAKEVMAKKSQMSTRDLEKAVNRLKAERVSRINIEKDLAELNKPSSQAKIERTIDRIDRMGNDLGKVANAVEKGTKLYNATAKIHNARHPDSQWTVIGKSGGDNNKKKKGKGATINVFNF